MEKDAARAAISLLPSKAAGAAFRGSRNGIDAVLAADLEHPARSWVVQQARNLLMDLDDAGIRARFVLHDRDASFSAAFDRLPVRRDQGHPHGCAGAEDEFDHGAMDRQLPP